MANSWMEAVKQYRSETGHRGKLPQKGSEEYDRIKAIQASIQQKQGKVTTTLSEHVPQVVASRQTRSKRYDNLDTAILRGLIAQAQSEPDSLKGGALHRFLKKKLKERDM